MNSIIPVAAFSDNYIWLICDEQQTHAAIVDPGDVSQLLPFLTENNIQPVAVLLTHLHFDHANGLPKLLETYPELRVYAPESEYQLIKNGAQSHAYGPATNSFNFVEAPHHLLRGGENLFIEEINTHFEVLSVPGHTSGHIAYFINAGNSSSAKEQNRLFCGDTLFAAGCGRVFDGSKALLHDSIAKIATLPDDTLIYCTHEYTMDNIGFAKWVEPNNEELLAREQADQARRDNNQPTVPTRLALEKATNPFMRTHLDHVVETVAQATGKTLTNSTEVFAAMRTWKDTEYD